MNNRKKKLFNMDFQNSINDNSNPITISDNNSQFMNRSINSEKSIEIIENMNQPRTRKNNRDRINSSQYDENSNRLSCLNENSNSRQSDSNYFGAINKNSNKLNARKKNNRKIIDDSDEDEDENENENANKTIIEKKSRKSKDNIVNDKTTENLLNPNSKKIQGGSSKRSSQPQSPLIDKLMNEEIPEYLNLFDMDNLSKYWKDIHYEVWNNRASDLNKFYYYFHKFEEKLCTTEWELKEEQYMLIRIIYLYIKNKQRQQNNQEQLLREHQLQPQKQSSIDNILNGNWGLFSLQIPSRNGQSCYKQYLLLRMKRDEFKKQQLYNEYIFMKIPNNVQELIKQEQNQFMDFFMNLGPGYTPMNQQQQDECQIYTKNELQKLLSKEDEYIIKLNFNPKLNTINPINNTGNPCTSRQNLIKELNDFKNIYIENENLRYARRTTNFGNNTTIKNKDNPRKSINDNERISTDSNHAITESDRIMKKTKNFQVGEHSNIKIIRTKKEAPCFDRSERVTNASTNAENNNINGPNKNMNDQFHHEIEHIDYGDDDHSHDDSNSNSNYTKKLKPNSDMIKLLQKYNISNSENIECYDSEPEIIINPTNSYNMLVPHAYPFMFFSDVSLIGGYESDDIKDSHFSSKGIEDDQNNHLYEFKKRKASSNLQRKGKRMKYDSKSKDTKIKDTIKKLMNKKFLKKSKIKKRAYIKERLKKRKLAQRKLDKYLPKRFLTPKSREIELPVNSFIANDDIQDEDDNDDNLPKMNSRNRNKRNLIYEEEQEQIDNIHAYNLKREFDNINDQHQDHNFGDILKRKSIKQERIDENIGERMQVEYAQTKLDGFLVKKHIKKNMSSNSNQIDSKKFLQIHINEDNMIDNIHKEYINLLEKLDDTKSIKSMITFVKSEMNIVQTVEIMKLDQLQPFKNNSENVLEKNIGEKYVYALESELKEYFNVLNKYSLSLYSQEFDIYVTSYIINCIESGNRVKKLLNDNKWGLILSKASNIQDFFQNISNQKKIEKCIKSIDDLIIRLLHTECNSLIILFLYQYNHTMYKLGKEIVYEKALQSIDIWFDILQILCKSIPKWLFNRFRLFIEPYVQYNMYCSLILNQCNEINTTISEFCKKIVEKGMKLIDGSINLVNNWKNELLMQLDIWLMKTLEYFGGINLNSSGDGNLNQKDYPKDIKKFCEIDCVLNYMSFKNFVTMKNNNINTINSVNNSYNINNLSSDIAGDDNITLESNNTNINHDFYIVYFKYIALSFILYHEKTYNMENSSASESMNSYDNEQKINIDSIDLTLELARQFIIRKAILNPLLKLRLMLNMYTLYSLIDIKASPKTILNEIQEILINELKNMEGLSNTNNVNYCDYLLILILTLTKRFCFTTSFFIRIYEAIMCKNNKNNTNNKKYGNDQYYKIKDLYDNKMLNIGYFQNIYCTSYIRYIRYTDIKKQFDQKNNVYILPLLAYVIYINEITKDNNNSDNRRSDGGLNNIIGFGIDGNNISMISEHCGSSVSIISNSNYSGITGNSEDNTNNNNNNNVEKIRKRYISLLIGNIKNYTYNDNDISKGVEISKKFLADYLLINTIIIICKTSNILLKTVYHKIKNFISQLYSANHFLKSIMLSLNLEYMIFISQDITYNNNTCNKQVNNTISQGNNAINLDDIMKEINKIIGFLMNGYSESSNLCNTYRRLKIINEAQEAEHILLQKTIEISIVKLTMFIKENYDLIIMNDLPINAIEVNYYSIFNGQKPYLPGIRKVFLDLLDTLLMDTEDFKNLLNNKRNKGMDKENYLNNDIEIDDDFLVDMILENEKEDEILINKFKSYKTQVLKNSNRSQMDFLKLLQDIIYSRKNIDIHEKIHPNFRFTEELEEKACYLIAKLLKIMVVTGPIEGISKYLPLQYIIQNFGLDSFIMNHKEASFSDNYNSSNIIQIKQENNVNNSKIIYNNTGNNNPLNNNNNNIGNKGSIGKNIIIQKNEIMIRNDRLATILAFFNYFFSYEKESNEKLFDLISHYGIGTSGSNILGISGLGGILAGGITGDNQENFILLLLHIFFISSIESISNLSLLHLSLYNIFNKLSIYLYNQQQFANIKNSNNGWLWIFIHIFQDDIILQKYDTNHSNNNIWILENIYDKIIIDNQYILIRLLKNLSYQIFNQMNNFEDDSYRLNFIRKLESYFMELIKILKIKSVLPDKFNDIICTITKKYCSHMYNMLCHVILALEPVYITTYDKRMKPKMIYDLINLICTDSFSRLGFTFIGEDNIEINPILLKPLDILTTDFKLDIKLIIKLILLIPYQASHIHEQLLSKFGRYFLLKDYDIYIKSHKQALQINQEKLKIINNSNFLKYIYDLEYNDHLHLYISEYYRYLFEEGEYYETKLKNWNVNIGNIIINSINKVIYDQRIVNDNKKLFLLCIGIKKAYEIYLWLASKIQFNINNNYMLLNLFINFINEYINQQTFNVFTLALILNIAKKILPHCDLDNNFRTFEKVCEGFKYIIELITFCIIRLFDPSLEEKLSHDINSNLLFQAPLISQNLLKAFCNLQEICQEISITHFLKTLLDCYIHCYPNQLKANNNKLRRNVANFMHILKDLIIEKIDVEIKVNGIGKLDLRLKEISDYFQAYFE